MRMINIAQRQQVHDLIILDLAIRSLQADYAKVSTLKLHKLYRQWLESVLAALQTAFHEKKTSLATQKIRLVGYKRLDAHFSEITFATSGNDAQLLYANEVLKQDVEQLLLQHIRIQMLDFRH